MYFSDAYGVQGEWFDRLLEADTQLFVDPFLIYAEMSGFWAGAGDQVAEYFQRGFELLAGHHDNPNSLQYKKTIELMLFPEPQEFGLGYVSSGTGGSGTGDGFSERIVSTMALAIELGLQELRRFEELGVLVDRIGRDRISDITCNILKPMFIEYTQDVCREHDIPMQEVPVEHSVFDGLRRRWTKGLHELPINPANDQAIILTPKRFLRELPSLNIDDWWEFVEPYFRTDLNLDLASKMRKEDIVAMARRHASKVREWTEARAQDEPDPYDVDRDPEGLHNWQRVGRAVPKELPIQFAELTTGNLDDFVREVNQNFKHYVEHRGGWKLLYNDDTGGPKRETSIQLLYKGVVEAYCDANGVALDREVELGRGPVDFIFTKTARDRVLLEVKKMRNGDYWNGLELQLTSYLNSARCDRGWFLAVRLTDTALEAQRTVDLPARTRAASEATGFRLRSDWIDARPKKSASTLKPGEDDSIGTAIDPEFPEGEGSAP